MGVIGPRRGAALIFVGLALLTAHHAAVWQSDLSLWQAAALVSPDKPRPALNVAAALINAGRDTDAIPWLDRAARLGAARSGWEARHTADLVTADRAVLAVRAGHRRVACVALLHAPETFAESRALAAQWCRKD